MTHYKESFFAVLIAVFSFTACGPAEQDVSTAAEVNNNQPEVTAASNADANDTRVNDASVKPPNFLVMIGDDMSVETVGCYKIGSDPAKTPTLDNLCNGGMRFDNFWSQPICSPTRATILTGQYGFRNGLGIPASTLSTEFPRPELLASAPQESGGKFGRETDANSTGNTGGNPGMGMTMGMGMGGDQAARARASSQPGLYADAYGLPAALTSDASKNYQTAAIGKWHLADDSNGGLDHPARLGFQHYSGNMDGGGLESFYSWAKVINGKHTQGHNRYATSVTVDDALEWLNNKNGDTPWFLWVAFNAPHAPWGAPPDELLSSETVQKLKNDDSTLANYQAMIEAMDTEIARLLQGIDPAERENTYIIFVGDNGTPNQGVTPPVERNKAKGTLYQGGINVPFIVDGPEVDRASVTKALANSVDLFSTILELAGTSESQKLNTVVHDSVSLVPVFKSKDATVRDFAYADQFGFFRNEDGNYRTIRNERYKLYRNLTDDIEEFYDLQEDPWEDANLLNAELVTDAAENYQQLKDKMASLISDKSRFKSN